MANRLDQILQLEHLSRQLFKQIKKELAELWKDSITGAEFGMLYTLSQRGPQIVTAMAQTFDVSVSHITHVVDLLENKGYIKRLRSQTDKRVVELHLTQEGRKIAEDLTRQKMEYFREKFAILEDEELQQLIAIYQKLTSS
ncbi:MarR family winged helix-turn-helix transcriptional regulator [Risungbinella massiliensis]|uniref:MarR family winged helix-turn-helix transcriptional regulator n=1 Tax=Risungbinella massiliensis TaxID=1329796 RepID=UPI0005CC7E58|nr:MarR family transcriptional regulator [Risungbinella massiliensis]